MTRCDNCKEMEVITTTCKACFPKEDRAEFIGLMGGDLKEMKPVRNYIDSKGML